MLRVEKIDLLLLYLGVLIALFYFPLRAIFFDSWVFLIFIPGIMVCWVFLNAFRYLKLRLNSVDLAVLLYFIFGISITVLGVVVFSTDKSLVIKTFTHYYLPSVFYFVARAAFNSNSASVITSKLSKMIIQLASIWVIDFCCEYYFVWILKQPMAIPWVSEHLSQIKLVHSDIDIKFNPLVIRTILVGSPKIVGLLSSVFFVLLLPVFISKCSNLKTPSDFLRCVLIGALLASLLYMQVYYISAMNKTAFVFMVLASVYITIRSINIYKALVLLISVSVIFGFIFFDNLSKSFQTYVAPIKTVVYKPNAEGSFALLFKTFDHFEESKSDSIWEDYLIGSYNSRDAAQMYQSSGQGVELRVLLLPGFFGIVWTLLVLFILIGLLRYAYKISLIPSTKTFGLMALGLLLIVMTDIHYPSVIKHGPLEVFMIVSGCLSAAYNSRKTNAFENFI